MSMSQTEDHTGGPPKSSARIKRRQSLPPVVNALDNKYYAAPARRTPRYYNSFDPKEHYIHYPLKDLEKRYGRQPDGTRYMIYPRDGEPYMTREWKEKQCIDPKFAFVKPTVSPRNQCIPKNAVPNPPEKPTYTELPHPSDHILENYATFEEYKNNRTFDDYYPKLFTAPHKVFPGRLSSTQMGDFNWWRTKPHFDWYNVSNTQKQTWFRNEKFNEDGQPIGERIIPSREVCRVPPTGTSDPRVDAAKKREKSHHTPVVEQLPRTKQTPRKEGFISLTRKYVPPVPRYPLVPCGKETIPQFGPFDPQTSMRRQEGGQLLSYRSNHHEGNMSSRYSATSSARRRAESAH